MALTFCCDLGSQLGSFDVIWEATSGGGVCLRRFVVIRDLFREGGMVPTFCCDQGSHVGERGMDPTFRCDLPSHCRRGGDGSEVLL